MSQQISVDETIIAYLTEHMPPEPPLLGELRAETGRMPQARMQIGYGQGCFMSVLLKAMGARRTIEVGVFTGYSALVTALALPSDGRILALDTSEEWTAIARRYWERAGVAERIDLRLAPASETLAAAIEAGEAGSYDFAFIDADKHNYGDYYEKCLTLLRAGGLILIDNSLWNGAVADTSISDGDTVAIRELNARIARDERVDSYLAPIGDGIHMAYKR